MAAASRGRPRKDDPMHLSPQVIEKMRAKISTTKIIDRLQKLVDGKVKMQPHAVTAAVALLRKVIPDLSAVEMSGQVEVAKPVEQLSDNELASELNYARTLLRAAGTGPTSPQPSQKVH